MAFGQNFATWRLKMRSLAGKFIDLVFPPVCAGCGSEGELFCDRCREATMWVVEPFCDRCGRPLSTAGQVCYTCHPQPPPLLEMRTAALYQGPLAEAIKKFKYEGYFGLAEPLADLMVAFRPSFKTAVDLVVPVPLHTTRERERGYNQAEMLVNGMVRKLDWRVEPSALKRVRRTRPQVGLSSAERRVNVEGAFLTEPRLIQGKNLLLIDDVRTTGATLVSAAAVLLANGAESVSAYCLAGAYFESESLLKGEA